MLLTLLDAATKASSMVDIPKIIDKLVEWGINVGKDLIGAILIYIIGRFIIRQISRLVAKILDLKSLDLDFLYKMLIVCIHRIQCIYKVMMFCMCSRVIQCKQWIKVFKCFLRRISAHLLRLI